MRSRTVVKNQPHFVNRGIFSPPRRRREVSGILSAVVSRATVNQAERGFGNFKADLVTLQRI
jgi:hypothetical protein